MVLSMVVVMVVLLGEAVPDGIETPTEVRELNI